MKTLTKEEIEYGNAMWELERLRDMGWPDNIDYEAQYENKH